MNGKKDGLKTLFRFKSLQTTILTVLVTLVSFTVLIYLIISVRQNRETVLETSTEYTQQLVDMVNVDIDSYFSNMNNMAQLIMDNSNIENFLLADRDNHLVEKPYVGRIEEQFRVLRETRDDIYNIGIIGKSGNYLVNNTTMKINPYADYSKTEWYQKAMEGEEVITPSHVQNLIADEYKWVVTLSQSIQNKDTGEIEGVLFIDLNYRSISTLCENISLGSKGYVFILDKDGKIIYHPRQQLLYSGVQKEETGTILRSGEGSFITRDRERLYTISRSHTTGWTVVGVAYLNEMMEKSNQTKKLYVLCAIVLIFVATFISIFLSNMITKPIRELRSSMKRVEEGNLEIFLQKPDYSNEIADLICSFNIMIRRIKQLMEKIIDEQAEKRRSELRALQAQINPHFLYNTLDSIIWMAESSKMAEVICMTSSLSKLLRKSISKQEEFVKVSDEIDYVREYLKIQKMRYHDKLDYEIDVDESVMRTPIAKLILQPLVENAIYHGIKLKEGKGLIRITGKKEKGKTVLKVIDNGVGMTKEVLAKLFVERETEDTGKVGVLNVQRRIQIYYGLEYGIHYESIPMQGTTVYIEIPFTDDFAPERRQHHETIL
ncbi:MAG: sensor histidine kinase [Lachnospiraceae bacterium]|nr:sensor histidine kinase [Lachnospiraceae bacterium]